MLLTDFFLILILINIINLIFFLNINDQNNMNIIMKLFLLGAERVYLLLLTYKK